VIAAVVEAIAGIIFPAISLTFKKSVFSILKLLALKFENDKMKFI
jgi:hypothetical protein